MKECEKCGDPCAEDAQPCPRTGLFLCTGCGMLDPFVKFALMAYANEPCGVCGKNITKEDLLDKRDVVFTGYKKKSGRVSRTSHGACWRGLTEEQRRAIKEEVSG